MPGWARRERQGDLSWIQENLEVFEVASKLAFEDAGRGAIVVDTTVQPLPDQGHPFGYFTQKQIEEFDDQDTQRMVRDYNPGQEFVIVLLKPKERISTYRVQPQQGGKGGST